MRPGVAPRHLRTDWIADAARQALHARVRLQARPGLGRDAAHLSVRLRDGSVWREEVVQCRGSGTRPLTAADLENKFTQAAQASMAPARIHLVLQSCRAFEEVADVAAFMTLLGGPT